VSERRAEAYLDLHLRQQDLSILFKSSRPQPNEPEKVGTSALFGSTRFRASKGKLVVFWTCLGHLDVSRTVDEHFNRSSRS
jgi:hypothetical protein